MCRSVLALAVPTVISQLITVVYHMADTIFIGQLGEPNQVAAAMLAMPPFILLTGVANLFGVALGGVLNILLDPIFIFGLHTEIKDAAVGTMLSNLIALGDFLRMLRRLRGETVVTLDLRRSRGCLSTTRRRSATANVFCESSA